jgi:hypothetical protein
MKAHLGRAYWSALTQRLLAGAYFHKEKALVRLRMFLNRLGFHGPKVFAIGFNKSGTTSLHTLFMSMKLISYHGTAWRDCADMNLLRTYDCFSDDMPKDLPKLDKTFPGSRFILQVRDLRSWIYSRLAHIERERAQGVYGGPDWDLTEYAIRAWIVKRHNYHLFVLSYFQHRPDDLLLVNFIRDEDAAQKVCVFLGHAGSREKPRENANPGRSIPEHYVEMLANALHEMGIPEQEAENDGYCPSMLDESQRAYSFPPDTSLLPENRSLQS